MAKKKTNLRRDDNRAGKVCIGIILAVFMLVMTVQSGRVNQKDKEKMALEEELKVQLQHELDRKEELKKYEEYIASPEYIEDIATSKLGLLYENQIIFRIQEQ